MPQQVTELLPVLARVARLNHFPQARNLQETIWKQLGGVMQALGKRVSFSHSSIKIAGAQVTEVCSGRCWTA